MTYDPADSIHATTDPDVTLDYDTGVTIDGQPVPRAVLDERDTNVEGPHAVWLDHSCDEWIIADGPDPLAVATKVRRFAHALEARADALELLNDPNRPPSGYLRPEPPTTG